MHPALEAILRTMLNRKYIGAKHTPESKLIKTKTRWIDKKGLKIFKREYQEILNENIILRKKKMTSKSSDWQVSLNPRKLNKALLPINK